MNRTVDRDSNREILPFASDHADDYFIELCALSSAGTLSAAEWRQLETHLSHCASCREIKAQYDSVIATTLPAMAASRVQSDDDHAPDPWSIEQAEASLVERIERENIVPDKAPQPSTAPSRWRLPLPYAGAAVFLVISACAGYYFGTLHGRSSSSATPPPPLRDPQIQPAPDDVRVVSTPIPGKREQQAAVEVWDLRHQLQASLSDAATLEERQRSLEGELAERKADLMRESQERADLEKRLSLAQSNAQSLQDRLNLAGNQSPRDAVQSEPLQGQVNELTASLQEKDQQIARREELLQHDRDIRDLMGARDLYIGEIYDVAKTGKTQKPFGRVFYTKGKSLVFYAYDLDQQPGVKLASTFQAWGRKGIDQQHDINLGILYQDDQNKKRWVLKSKDSATLTQIDAVFVTVEPNGQSSKPTGKPLLFTYLRLTPNHP